MRAALIVLILLSASLATAQPTITRALHWNQPGVADVAEAQALVYRLSVDGAPSQPMTPACALVNTVVSCTAPAPALGAGSHTLVLSVSNGFGTASASITGSEPSAPAGFRMSITIVIN